MAKRSIDWVYFRHKYVSGDESVTLSSLSELPNAPTLGTLKNRSRRDSWAEQRKQYHNQVVSRAAETVTAHDAIAQSQKLVDAAELITRHVKLSRVMQQIVAKRLVDIKENPNQLTPRDLVAWLNAATAIERLAYGLATESKEYSHSIDVTSLSDAQLESLIQGQPPEHVLNSHLN